MSDFSFEQEPTLFCGGCCQNVRLALSNEEATRLDEAGTDLVEVLEIPTYTAIEINDSQEAEIVEVPFSWADELGQEALQARMSSSPDDLKDLWAKILEHSQEMKHGQGLFAILGRCGLLQENGSCGAYDTRPDICEGFVVGSESCNRLRARASVATPMPVSIQSRRPDSIMQ